MWLTTQWKLHRALRRYGRDGDVDAVLGADWSRSREIFAFFREIVDRLHGEEITPAAEAGRISGIAKPDQPAFSV